MAQNQKKKAAQQLTEKQPKPTNYLSPDDDIKIQHSQKNSGIQLVSSIKADQNRVILSHSGFGSFLGSNEDMERARIIGPSEFKSSALGESKSEINIPEFHEISSMENIYQIIDRQNRVPPQQHPSPEINRSEQELNARVQHSESGSRWSVNSNYILGRSRFPRQEELGNEEILNDLDSSGTKKDAERFKGLLREKEELIFTMYGMNLEIDDLKSELRHRDEALREVTCEKASLSERLQEIFMQIEKQKSKLYIIDEEERTRLIEGIRGEAEKQFESEISEMKFELQRLKQKLEEESSASEITSSLMKNEYSCLITQMEEKFEQREEVYRNQILDLKEAYEDVSCQFGLLEQEFKSLLKSNQQMNGEIELLSDQKEELKLELEQKRQAAVRNPVEQKQPQCEMSVRGSAVRVEEFCSNKRVCEQLISKTHDAEKKNEKECDTSIPNGTSDEIGREQRLNQCMDLVLQMKDYIDTLIDKNQQLEKMLQKQRDLRSCHFERLTGIQEQIKRLSSQPLTQGPTQNSDKQHEPIEASHLQEHRRQEKQVNTSENPSCKDPIDVVADQINYLRQKCSRQKRKIQELKNRVRDLQILQRNHCHRHRDLDLSQADHLQSLRNNFDQTRELNEASATNINLQIISNLQRRILMLENPPGPLA